MKEIRISGVVTEVCFTVIVLWSDIIVYNADILGVLEGCLYR